MITQNELKEILCGNVVIVGVGNTDRGDDGAGPALIAEIEGRVAAQCIDVGVAPENFLEKIAQMSPDTVLIVDAADFGGIAGQMQILEPQEIAAGGLSTHASSLQVVCDYLNNRVSLKVYLLAIQPYGLKWGGLSSKVKKSVRTLADMLIELLPT